METLIIDRSKKWTAEDYLQLEEAKQAIRIEMPRMVPGLNDQYLRFIPVSLINKIIPDHPHLPHSKVPSLCKDKLV